MAEEIFLGLTQGDITSIIIVAVVALAALFLLATLLKLSVALIRLGCLVIIIGVVLFAVMKMLGS